MKNCFRVTILFFLIVQRGFTQSYHPIPESQIIWQEYQFRTIIPCITTSTFIYYFDGDTFISPQNYKKLFSEGSVTQSCNGNLSTSLYLKQYEGAFRQDTALRQVYLMIKDNFSESTLYDFNLIAGDSLHFLESNFNDNGWVDIISNPAVIESVDSILIDGTLRKRMRFLQAYDACGPDTSAVIEGIGNTRGFIYPRVYPCSIYKILNCVTINGNQVYGTSDTCFTPAGSGYNAIGNTLENDFLSEPVLLSDGSVLIRFSIDYPRDARIVISNKLGQQVKSISLSGIAQVILSHREFLSGYYTVTLYDHKKIMSRKKILIF